LSIEISIVVATYNSGDTLSKCLCSIISQKCSNVELIVIDGQSTDSTPDILRQFDSDIDHMISENDEGIYDAWNKGLSLASGSWIMFVGSDDQLRTGCIEGYKRQIAMNGNYDFISGRIMLVNHVGDELREFGEPYDWGIFKRHMNLAHVSSLHNRQLYDRYGDYDIHFKICGDYELLLRPKENLKVKFIDQIFANMAIGGVSFGSFDALSEARNAKLRHEVNKPSIIWLQYFLSVITLVFNRTIRRKFFFGVIK
jgi:glycosyltransferase involved in cell wall biosynthesis